MLVRSIAAARLVFAAFAVFAFAAAAQAQLLTFVSNAGDDTRPCTVQAQPCKTLLRAAAVTLASGTVRILSDLAAQPATNIVRSVTVEGGGNSVIGAITISASAAVVTLRGLHLTGRDALANGIIINSAAAVHIEDCAVERYTNDGIKLGGATPTKLFISNTVSASNGSDGFYAENINAQAVIENSRFEGNAGSGLYLKVESANVSGSVASGNVSSGMVLRSTGAKITQTTADNNGGRGFLVYSGAARFSSAQATRNIAGLTISDSAFVYIANCMFLGNFNGDVNDQGFAYSYGGNAISWWIGNDPVAQTPF